MIGHIIRICICGILLFCYNTSLINSQSFKHRKFKYDWKDEHPPDLSQHTRYASYDAVVLYEETTLNINYSNIKRYQVIQFNSQQSIDRFNLFRVPIPMDPYREIVSNIYRSDTNTFPKLLYERINFFDARIIRNGEYEKAVLDEVAYRNEERLGENMVPFYIHYFYVRNLKPGDQLEIIISHHFPGNTFKYYLNDILPKQEVLVNINNTYLGHLNVFDNRELGQLIDHRVSNNGEVYQYEFKFIEPINPIPQTLIRNLPRIEFFENKKSERSTKLFAPDVIDTLEWKDYLFKFVSRIDPNELRSWENYDQQSFKVSTFYNRLKTRLPKNASGSDLMKYIHDYVVDSMEYKNDFLFFIHKEGGFEDIGKFVEKNILREVSRHNFYYNILDRIDEPYYRVFLQDKRYSYTDTSQLHPIYVDHLSYAIFDTDSNLHWFYPKSNRFGWYADELPFYLENQTVHLIPQTVPRKIYDREPDNIPYPVVQTPYTDPLDNYKYSNTQVNISTKKRKTTISNSLILSGQYSTITRGNFLYNFVDTTISPTYYRNLFKTDSSSKITVKSIQKEAPFKVEIDQTLDDYDNIYQSVDQSFIIDLGGIISIPYLVLEPQYYHSTYQHDFQGIEFYVVDIYFDELVEILNTEELNRSFTGLGFKLSSSLTKIADNDYRLKVEKQINNQFTMQEDMGELSNFYNYCKFLSNLKIEFRK